MKAGMLTVCAIGLIAAAYGLADAIDRAGDARADLARTLRDDCMPRNGQTAWIRSNGSRMECRIYTTAGEQYGMARQLVSATAIETQP